MAKWVIRCGHHPGANGTHQGGFYETLTSLVYFALLATPLYLRPTLVRATSGAIRSPHASLLPHALLSPCSLPAALAYLTLSFLMPSILCLSAAHRQPLWSAHSSAALAPCCQLGTN